MLDILHRPTENLAGNHDVISTQCLPALEVTSRFHTRQMWADIIRILQIVQSKGSIVQHSCYDLVQQWMKYLGNVQNWMDTLSKTLLQWWTETAHICIIQQDNILELKFIKVCWALNRRSWKQNWWAKITFMQSRVCGSTVENITWGQNRLNIYTSIS